MSGKAIIGIGMVTVDFTQILNQFPIEGSTNKIKQEKIVLGGPIGRGILTCQRLGYGCEIVGMVGRGVYANELRELLIRNSVKHNLIEAEDTSDSQHSFILVTEEKGSRTTFWRPQPKSSRQCIERAKKSLKNASVVLLDCTDIDLTREVALECRKNNIPSVLDTGSYKKNVESLFPYIDYLIVPANFLKIAPWIRSGNDKTQALKELSRKSSSILVGFTEGEKGGAVLVTEREELITFNAYKVETIDSCGAGDTFHGAFAYGIALGWPVRKIVAFSAWVAAMKCSSLGNEGLPTQKEALQWESEIYEKSSSTI
jgi:sugar/nucleoside kinase (ribokinase family)